MNIFGIYAMVVRNKSKLHHLDKKDAYQNHSSPPSLLSLMGLGIPFPANSTPSHPPTKPPSRHESIKLDAAEGCKVVMRIIVRCWCVLRLRLCWITIMIRRVWMWRKLYGTRLGCCGSNTKILLLIPSLRTNCPNWPFTRAVRSPAFQVNPLKNSQSHESLCAYTMYNAILTPYYCFIMYFVLLIHTCFQTMMMQHSLTHSLLNMLAS